MADGQMKGRWEDQELMGLACLMKIHIRKYLVTHTWSVTDSNHPHMERHLVISETLVPDILHKEISPLLRDLDLPLTDI